MTAAIPTTVSARGAYSRLDPQPKLRPATMTSPGCTSWANSGRISMNGYLPSSASEVMYGA